MNFSFLKYWNYGSRYCGLEYASYSTGNNSISGLTAIRKKGEFHPEKTFQSSSSVKEIASNLPKNQHAFLCITHQQVLLKKTDTKGSVVKIVTSAYPNVDLNDFYYEVLPVESGNMVALCRRELVHEIISSFEKHQISIVGFSLGFLTIQNLLPAIGETTISFTSYTISNNGNIIVSYEKIENEEATYKISDIEVNNKFLLSLSSLFNYAKGNVNTYSNFEHKNQELRKHHYQKTFFQKGLTTAVMLLLVLLLINFILFSSYFSEFQEMNEKYQAKISQKEVYVKKLEILRKKEEMAGNILSNSGSRTSFYLNRLVSSKPESLLLKEISYSINN